MFIDVFNIEKSKFSDEGEIIALRAALLLSDKAGYAGRNTYIFDAERCFKDMNEKVRAEKIKYWLTGIYPKETQYLNDLSTLVEIYHRALSKKSKNKDVMIHIGKCRAALDLYQKNLFDCFAAMAKENKFFNLLQYYKDKNSPLKLSYLQTNSQLNVRIADQVFLTEDDFMILDKSVFVEADGILIPEDGYSFKVKKSDKPAFIYKEITSIPDLEALSPEHFNIVRNNFLQETSGFRQALINAKKIARQTFFLAENSHILFETYNEVKSLAQSIEKTANENTLLKEVQSGKSCLPHNKIYLAFSTLEDIVIIFERLKIFNATDSVYIRLQISRKADVKNSIPFLIVEKRSN